jgi:hypothetical protein
MFTPVWTDTKIAQPSASGDWAPGAYDPQTGYLFFTTGVSTRKFSPTGRISVKGTREYGLITALDSRTNKQVWQKEVPVPGRLRQRRDGYRRAACFSTAARMDTSARTIRRPARSFGASRPASAPMRRRRPTKSAASSMWRSPPVAAAMACVKRAATWSGVSSWAAGSIL